MFGRSKNETELLKASLEGSAEAFEVLVGRYQSLVCAITYSSTGSVEKSEELAQESFLRAWKCLHQLQDLAKFRAWLTSIARSTAMNWLRSRRRDVVGKASALDNAEDKATDEAGPEEIAMRNEQQALVAHALAEMPESLREPLVLFYREHQSAREVARQLGLSEAAVRQRISRARETLRDRVATIVETTIARTRPGKAFTAAVAAALATSAVRTTTTAAAATAAASSGSTAILSGLTAKLVTLAAGLAIVAGGVVLYTHNLHAERPVSPASQSQTAQPQAIAAAMPPVALAATPGPFAEDGSPTTDSRRTVASETPDRTRLTATTQMPTYKFEPRDVLSGRITDVNTGEPVRDATVVLGLGSTPSARTDSNGFYSFRAVDGNGSHQLSVHSMEYVGIPRGDGSPTLYLSNDTQTVRHFQLSRACMVDVWVTDVNGAPISNAYVTVSLPAGNGSQDLDDSGRRHRTDPNGYLLLGGIPPAPGDYLITAYHYGTSSIRRSDGVAQAQYDFAPGAGVVRLNDPNVIRQVQIALEKGRDIQGYAHYADGTPATGIDITASPAWWRSNYVVPFAPLNPDGTFTFRHIVPGAYNITTWVHEPSGSGAGTPLTQVHLPPADGQTLVLQVPGESPVHTSASIRGRLIFTGPRRPMSVSVSALSARGQGGLSSVSRSADGQLGDAFAVDCLEPGTYTLRFSGTNVVEKTIENITAPSDGLQVELAYAESIQPPLTGTVVDGRTGQPIQEFRLRLQELESLDSSSHNQRNDWMSLKDGQGAFRVEAAGRGLYRIQATADGYAPLWSDEINTDLAGPVALMLSAGGNISGLVVDTDGKPIDGARVIPFSQACGLNSGTTENFMTEDGAVKTTAGIFALTHLPPGVETLKITHPDHAFATVSSVMVTEGETTGGLRITLSAGGTIEGYVYDEQGKPQAGQSIRCHDDNAYRRLSISNQLAGTATDSNGFYRISHLPETLCIVTKDRGTFRVGVVSRAVVPQNGHVTRLDFGGTPLVRTRLLLTSPETTGGAAFQSCALTDEYGAFTFQGVPNGTHAIYYEGPDWLYKWLKIAQVTVADTNVALGAIPGAASQLTVAVDPPATVPAWKTRSITMADRDRPGSAAMWLAQAPAVGEGPWTLDNIRPGAYMLTTSRQDFVSWRTRVDLAPGQGPWQVSVAPPRGTAGVSGRIHGRTTSLVLWREDRNISAHIPVKTATPFSFTGLPAGKYFIGEETAFCHEMPPLTEFTLSEGENKQIDVEATAQPAGRIGRLLVLIADEEAVPRNDVRVWLESTQGRTEPLETTSSGSYFVAPPGRYTLRVQASGYQTSTMGVTVPPFTPAESKPPAVIVRLHP
jgi:RNA polymerase sigma factor (sigma-70 family)